METTHLPEVAFDTPVQLDTKVRTHRVDSDQLRTRL